MRTNHLFSLICLFVLSGSVIGQSFSSWTGFPLSVPDATATGSTCFGAPIVASAMVNVTGLNGVVGNANEITVKFALNAPANSAGDFVVRLVSPSGTGVNLVSRIGGCNNLGSWDGLNVISIQQATPLLNLTGDPSQAVAGSIYRPSSGMTAAQGNTFPTTNNGMTAFQGGSRNGLWTLQVRDMKNNALTATITHFSLEFNKGISLNPATVPPILCPGADYAITANSVGVAGSFAGSTDFLIELSDVMGNFVSPFTIIGRSDNQTSINGAINVHIQSGITPSMNYNIRIKAVSAMLLSSTPPGTGAATIIGNSVAVDISALPSSAITPSTSLTLVGVGPKYEFCQTPSGSSAASLMVAQCAGCTYNWTSLPVGMGGVGASNDTFQIGNIATLPAGTVHTVIVTDPASTCKDTTSFVAVIRKDMPATPTITASGTSCLGVDLIATVSPAVLAATYEWFDAAGASVYNPGTSMDTIYYGAPAGAYTVVVTDPNTGCSSDSSVATTVNGAATLVLQPFGYHIDPATPLDSFIFCSNSTYNVNVMGGGPASVYTWSANGSIITTGPSYIPPVTATYTVTTTDANGCLTTVSQYMQVRIAPSPAPTISASGACGGATLSASAAPLGNTLNWYVDGMNTNTTGQTHNTITSGNYTVRLTAPNTCYAESFPVAITATPDAAIVNAVGGNCLDGVNPVTLVAAPIIPGTFGSGQSLQWYMNAVAIPGGISDTLDVTFAGEYTVVVIDGACESPASAPIIVNEAPSTPPITSSSTCQGALLMTTSSAGLTYQWYLGSTPVGVSSHTHTAATAGNYTVRVTNLAGCTTRSTDTISISPAPIAPAVTNANTYCVDATHPITLQATGATAPQTYQWYMNGVATGNGTSSLVVTTAGTFTVSIKAGLCESTSTSAAITYLLAATPTIATASNCVGTLLSSSTSPSGTYKWYKDGIVIPGATSQTYTTTSPGSYTVTVFNLNPILNCESAPSAPHVIIPAPAAPNIVDPDSLPVINVINTACMGTSGTALFATGATAPQIYKWFYNGSPISNATTSPYTATATGVYTVKVADGTCLSAASNSVTVYPAPGMPTISGTTGCIGATLTSSAAPASGSYEWYLDGNLVGGNTQSIIASSAGTYTVVISSASPANCPSPSSAGKVISASIGTPTIQAFNNNLAGPFSFCAGAGGTLTSGLTGMGYTYTWSVGANVLSYDSTITPTSTGTYILNVANGSGPDACSASISQAVTMAQPPVAPSLTVGTPNCSGTLLTSSLGSTYKWYKDIAGTFTQILGASSQTYTAATPGTYRVTITNVNGCGNTSVSKTTTATAGVASVSMGSSKPGFNYCSADRDTLIAVFTGTPNSFVWRKGSTIIPGATTSKYVPNSASNTATAGAGTYSVTIIASATCSAVASQAITMTGSPAAPTITSQSATNICAGASVNFTATSPANVTTFLWIRNGANMVSIPGNGLTSGNYTSTVNINTSAAVDVYTLRTENVSNTTCRSAESAPVSVNRMKPVANFNNCAGANLNGTAVTLCKNSSLSAIATGPAYTYSWYYGATLKQSGIDYSYDIQAAGNHRLVIKQTVGGVTCSTGSANASVTLAATGCTPVICRLASDKDNADELIGASFEAVEMVAYPNPTSDLLNVDILNSGATEGKIVLYNTLGQVVLAKNVTLSEGKVSEQLDLGNLAQGIYSLSFQTANGNKVQKVVKE